MGIRLIIFIILAVILLYIAGVLLHKVLISAFRYFKQKSEAKADDEPENIGFKIIK